MTGKVQQNNNQMVTNNMWSFSNLQSGQTQMGQGSTIANGVSGKNLNAFSIYHTNNIESKTAMENQQSIITNSAFRAAQQNMGAEVYFEGKNPMRILAINTDSINQVDVPTGIPEIAIGGGGSTESLLKQGVAHEADSVRLGDKDWNLNNI